MAYQQQQNGQFSTEPTPAYREPAPAEPDYSQKPGQPAHQGSFPPSQPYPPQQPMQQQPVQQQYAPSPSMYGGKWENNLCNCSPCENCLLATFVPCLLLGRTSERMRDPTMRTYEAVNTDCLLMFGITYFTCCGWIYVMIKRNEIRERFGIAGGGCGDCCTTYWCPCCALIQQEKEVKKRLEAGPIAQGYQPNKEGMTMQPQHQQNF